MVADLLRIETGVEAEGPLWASGFPNLGLGSWFALLVYNGLFGVVCTSVEKGILIEK